MNDLVYLFIVSALVALYFFSLHGAKIAEQKALECNDEVAAGHHIRMADNWKLISHLMPCFIAVIALTERLF